MGGVWKMKFGSVCSGIEAASVAWNGLGWKVSWFAEIEQFPSAVLNHHYPEVPNLGDMTKLPEKILNGDIDAPDILCGGTPYQAFSVAGNRQSLDDARGNLTLTFCEIADVLDTVRDIPAIIFWENVPGVLNTKDNAFGCFLAKLAGEDSELKPSGKRWTNAGVVFGHKRTVAWRVLDAQYFGLAQRRKRVFVVASARERFDPAEILFEFEGLRRDIAPSRGERKNATSSIEDRSPDGCPTVGTLMARDYKGIGNQDLEDGRGLCFEPRSADGVPRIHDDLCPTLNTMGCEMGDNQLAVAFHPTQDPISSLEISHAITSGSTKGCATSAVAKQMAVRRLTPRECERLQGFPDDYTKIPYRNKDSEKCPDGLRYKALGNSWAVPVVRWIGERIAKQIL
jgi:DNA (cytosine-5)-methyltransferase 1